jgi:hypothetical protein
MKEVPMPPNDGAIWPCNLPVQRPKPIFWEYCGKKAVKAYRDEPEKMMDLRCSEHVGVEA